jgi:hypothetical protein
MNNRTPPAYKGTNPIRYGSTWQLTILGSNNISAKTTFNISTASSGKKLTTLPKTVLASYIVEST